MNGTRVLDDLARMLVQPMPRRRALRLLGASVVGVIVPAVAPNVARGTAHIARSGECGRGERACPSTVQGAVGPDKCCGDPYRYTCGPSLTEPTCEQRCPSPGTLCPTGKKDQYGFDEAICCTAPMSLGCCKGECIPNCKILYGQGFTPCCAACCNPGQVCKDGTCVDACPGGRPRCGGTCCKQGQTCKKGKCCPNNRACGDRCCPANTTCAFGRVAGRSARVCCGPDRVVSRKLGGKTTRFCCPAGTVDVGGGCCPPNDASCCDDLAPLDPGGDDELAPLNPYQGRTFCVRGKPQKL